MEAANEPKKDDKKVAKEEREEKVTAPAQTQDEDLADLKPADDTFREAFYRSSRYS